tara:strand:+ start:39788 stop:42403 length:2616 start_codon:yes stop_codon:yes gene_type:complete
MMRWPFSKPPDEQDTERLIEAVQLLRSGSYFQSADEAHTFITDLLVDVCAESNLCPSALIAEPLAEVSWQLLHAEPFLFDVTTLPKYQESLESASELRTYLRRAVKLLSDEQHYLGLWREKMAIILRGIIAELPVNVLIDPYPDGTLAHQPILSPQTPLCDFIDDFPDLLRRLIGTFYDKEIEEPDLYHYAREQFEARLCAASGVRWSERNTTTKQFLAPQDQRNMASPELSDLYTDQTFFAGLFTLPVPIPIPNEVRFEHTVITGGTGHGKTQLLQYLIYDDLVRALDQKMSVVVIDPDGTLLKTLSQTSLFESDLLGQRTIFIDPTDSQHPVGLNLFDVAHLDGADTRAQETIENNTIELFEYFFDALLGSELTSRQSTLFRYLGLLLMQIPGGNIHTLRELMEDGEQYRPFMEKMTGTAKTFFETRFFDKSLNATKQQILARLWGVLSNRSLDRLFSAKCNTVNFDSAMLEGKIIFVNTSKEYLGEEGSHIFARMIVALIGQGLIRRAGLVPEQRTETFIYFDEAEGVVDQTLVRLLAQVRKYKGAITLAHQHLEQFSTSARAGVLANTSIKLAGGVSASDATKLATEFRVDKDIILSQRKSDGQAQFALFAKNITPAAMTFTVPLGFVERQDRLSVDEHAALIEHSRRTYGQWPETEQPEVGPTPKDPDPEVAGVAPASESIEPTPTAPIQTESAKTAAPPVFYKEGGGGARHREIEMLVKELGEAAGFRASVEETILDGEGRVDVILRRDGLVVCCEVSVTTTKEHELLNVQKCLRFGADKVWVIAASAKHKTSLSRHISAALSETERGSVEFLLEEELAAQLVPKQTKAGAPIREVRGYRVKSSAISTDVLRKQLQNAFDDSDQT